jgi:uncharacterized membrane protein YgcG
MAIAFLSILGGGASAADNTASITVHLRQCNGAPTTDYFTDCHDNGVSGVDVSIAGLTGPTGPSGDVVVMNLGPGDYDVSAGVPGASSTFSYCSSDLGRDESFDTGDFTVDALAVGELVTCDVYGVVEPTVPDTGSLTIHKRVCAEGQPTSDIFTDCHGNVDGAEGIDITVGGVTQTVGADGNLTWTDIPNGTVDVTEDTSPTGTKATRVYCSTDAGESSMELVSESGNFSVDINGNDLICDSYSLMSTGTTNGNGSSGNGSSGNGSSGNGSSGGGATSGGGTTLPNTGVGPSHSGNNAYFAMIALLFVAVSGFGVAHTVRVRK